MGWDGPQGKPPFGRFGLRPRPPSTPVPEGRGALRAVCLRFAGGSGEKMPPAFVLHLTIQRGRMQERQCPITENRLSCMETVPEESKFS